MGSLQLQLAPTTIFMDFETAAQNAVRTVFTGITVKGCFFHYTQAIWRKTTLVYKSPTETTTTFDNFVRRAAVLPLVPMDLIEDVWFNALNVLEDIDIPANTTTFTDYATTQWIDGDRQVWNHFNTDGPRTTNHIEGWHNKLKKVSHAHPNIYTLISTFKDIHAANSCPIYDILCLMLIVKLISMLKIILVCMPCFAILNNKKCIVKSYKLYLRME